LEFHYLRASWRSWRFNLSNREERPNGQAKKRRGVFISDLARLFHQPFPDDQLKVYQVKSLSSKKFIKSNVYKVESL